MSDYNLESLESFLKEARQLYRSEPDGARVVSLYVHPTTGRVPYNRNRLSDLDDAWAQIQEIADREEMVQAIVTGWNKGGLLVRWGKLQGFVPISQLKQVPLIEDEVSRDQALARWVGEELCLRVIELDRTRNRLVFSERATIWEPNAGQRLLRELSPGDIREGLVSNICDFGVFVDLGGVDGLIHISELSWGRVTHPRHIVELGQQVKVYVLSVDKEKGHVGLSLKRLHPNPWSWVEQKYQVGDLVEATITSIVEFGAFAQIEEGLEGLIHISEISDEHVTDPYSYIHEGQQVRVRILRIDSSRHRLSLSLRPATADTSD